MLMLIKIGCDDCSKTSKILRKSQKILTFQFILGKTEKKGLFIFRLVVRKKDGSKFTLCTKKDMFMLFYWFVRLFFRLRTILVCCTNFLF